MNWDCFLDFLPLSSQRKVWTHSSNEYVFYPMYILCIVQILAPFGLHQLRNDVLRVVFTLIKYKRNFSPTTNFFPAANVVWDTRFTYLLCTNSPWHASRRKRRRMKGILYARLRPEFWSKLIQFYYKQNTLYHIQWNNSYEGKMKSLEFCYSIRGFPKGGVHYFIGVRPVPEQYRSLFYIYQLVDFAIFFPRRCSKPTFRPFQSGLHYFNCLLEHTPLF